MNQRRLINELLAFVLIISLTLGCSFATSLSGTPTATLSGTPTATPTATPTGTPDQFTTGGQGYTGEGRYHNTSSQSGIEMTNAYTFSITFRSLPDRTIVGEGVLTKVEASYGGQGLQCNDLGTSSLTFPLMKVSGIVKPDAAGQPDATFQLTIEALPSTNTWQFACKVPYSGSITLDEGKDQGFILADIEIAAMDGAQANGEIHFIPGPLTPAEGGQTWELQIHKQQTP